MAATRTVPHVVSFPQSVPAVISQDRLTAFLALRQRIDALEVEWKQAEAEIRAAVEADFPVEPGVFTAFLKTTERRSVAWKAVCERELGSDYCTRVLAATKPDRFTHLVVDTEQATPKRQSYCGWRPPHHSSRSRRR